MRRVFAVCLVLAAISTVAITGLARENENWNPALAAKYLDGRQEAWFAWRQAQSADGPCISCHTGMPYLLARPALRRALHDATHTLCEQGLIDARHSHAART